MSKDERPRPSKATHVPSACSRCGSTDDYVVCGTCAAEVIDAKGAEVVDKSDLNKGDTGQAVTSDMVRRADEFLNEMGVYLKAEHVRELVKRACWSGPCASPDWTDEDPGNCIQCGKAFELVRPGKSQPTCRCDDEPETFAQLGAKVFNEAQRTSEDQCKAVYQHVRERITRYCVLPRGHEGSHHDASEVERATGEASKCSRSPYGHAPQQAGEGCSGCDRLDAIDSFSKDERKAYAMGLEDGRRSEAARNETATGRLWREKEERDSAEATQVGERFAYRMCPDCQGYCDCKVPYAPPRRERGPNEEGNAALDVRRVREAGNVAQGLGVPAGGGVSGEQPGPGGASAADGGVHREVSGRSAGACVDCGAPVAEFEVGRVSDPCPKNARELPCCAGPNACPECNWKNGEHGFFCKAGDTPSVAREYHFTREIDVEGSAAHRAPVGVRCPRCREVKGLDCCQFSPCPCACHIIERAAGPSSGVTPELLAVVAAARELRDDCSADCAVCGADDSNGAPHAERCSRAALDRALAALDALPGALPKGRPDSDTPVSRKAGEP